ncbi:MAG: PQQ-binding-like beta-propeller repeat protein [Fuerstiella sp.]
MAQSPSARQRMQSPATLLGVLLVLVVAESACGLDTIQVESLPPESSLHGSVEHLRSTLVESGDQGRLLGLAQRHLEIGNRDIAFQALLELFAQDSDSFTTVSATGETQSSYRAALQLLMSSHFQVRSDWATAVEPLAAAAIKKSKNDPDAMLSIAQRFPLTNSGMQIMLARALLAKTRGQHGLAAAIVSDLQHDYADIFSRELSRYPAISKWQDTHHSETRIAGSPNTAPPPNLTLPWPKPLWTWTESIWKFPGASVFGGLHLPENRSAFAANAWQPFLSEDTLYVRTPVHVLAFDKHTGRIKWSIETDTVDGDVDLANMPENLLAKGSSSLEQLLQTETLGSVTATEQYVFFIDHFRRFSDRYSIGRFGNNPMWRQQQFNQLTLDSNSTEAPDGHRLVAVRLTPQPEIAWVVGDSPNFNYQLSPPSNAPQSPPTKPETSETQQPDQQSPPASRFAGQRFCGVPLVYDEMLFVLSDDKEVVRLNCIDKSTGRFLWQKPLAYGNETTSQTMGRFIVTPEQVRNASLCAVDGHTIICALNSGTVIGTRIVDGQYLWATSVRDELESGLNAGNQRRLLNALAMATRAVPSFRSHPVVVPGQLIWAAPFCSTVQCLKTDTGEIQWKVPRAIAAMGELEGSTDHYAVASTSKQVVMIGPRHIRALSTATGEQLWLSPLQAQSGRAFCSDDACLVPLLDGTLASFDLATGLQRETSTTMFNRLSSESPGTVVADKDVVCVVSPTEVTVTSTIAAYQQNIEAIERQANSSTVSDAFRMDMATTHLISGDFTSGIQELTAITSSSVDRQVSADATDLLAETLLSMLRQSESSSTASKLPHTDLSRTELSQQLAELTLNPEQKLRLALLQPNAEILTETAKIDGEPLNIRLAPDWTVRADVAAWNTLPPQQAELIAHFDPAKHLSLSQIEHAILFPKHVGSTQQQLSYAQQLSANHRDAAAELFLLSAFEAAPLEDKSRIRDSISSLRNSFATKLEGDLLPTVPDKWDIKIEETMKLSTGSQIAAAIGVRRRIADVPDWYGQKLFLTNREMLATDFHNGVVTNATKLPASADPVSTDYSFATPSLIPLTSEDHVGVVSLLNNGGPKLLWWKRVERPEADVSAIDVASFGSNYLTVSTASQLICYHPATGNVLWNRRISTDSARQGMFQRKARFTGDGQATGILGHNLNSSEVIRTQDGKRLQSIALEIPRGQAPITSGRRLLFQKNQTLVLIDLLTGENMLADEPELSVLRAGQAWLLKDHRAITISAELDVLVLNLQTAKTEIKVSIEGIVQPTEIIGMTAVETHGKLFVLLKDAQTARSMRSAASDVGDPRLDSGRLVCIDVATGKLLWHRDNLPCVMPEIRGDACPVLICWAFQHPQYQWEQRIGQLRNDDDDRDERASLVLTILDAATGKQLHEQTNLGTAEPLRCVHDAAHRRITIETQTSLIDVTYAAVQ